MSSITLAHAEGTGSRGGSNASEVSDAAGTNRNNKEQAHDGSSVDQTSPGNTYGSTGKDAASTPPAPEKAAGATETTAPNDPGKTYPDPKPGAQDGSMSKP